MKTKFFFILIIVFCFFSCDKNDEDANNSNQVYKVAGKVYLGNDPQEGVTVSVNEQVNYTAITDQNGEFTIYDIPKGDHLMKLYKEYGNEVFSQDILEIGVYNNVELNSLKLPDPLNLNNPQDITGTSLTLSWNEVDHQDFYEYKLYRSDNPGLDEETGELIYVGTNTSDTLFTDTDLFSDKEYYYRVFLKDQYGQLGGSNIVSATTLLNELIPDGSFENANSNILHWDINYGPLINEITNQTSADGDFSLYNQNAISTGVNVYTTMTTKEFINIESNRTYKISGYARVEGQHGDPSGNIWIMIYQNNSTVALLDFQFQSTFSNMEYYIEDTGWVYKSTTFQVNTETPIKVTILFSFENTWIDGLKLEPQ